VKTRALILIVALAAAAAGAPAVHTTSAASLFERAGLPSEEMATRLLSDALAYRHPQYVDMRAGDTKVRSFVVFPDRGDNAPVLVITANNQGMSDWLRAVGDNAAAQGFIAVVPDLPLGDLRAADAVTRQAIAMPASNGNGASVRFNFALRQAQGVPSLSRDENVTGTIDVTIQSPVLSTRSFELSDHAWHNALAYLGQIDKPVAQQAGRGQAGAGAVEPPPTTGGMRGKRPDLPANFLVARRTVESSPRKGEWVDIPMASGVKLHTWISYPQTTGRAPVVLVFQPGPGMDMGEPTTPGGGANWLRAIADQLAAEGFIAVLPDLTSGLGPNGGNHDSFRLPDESGAALNRIPHSEVLNRIRVAKDYALKLPMSNGRVGATGFCMGGGLAWEVAAEIEGINASVVFYGGPPEAAVMARIKAPVIAFFGRNDLGLAPRIAPATADMKRLGKDFEVHVYEEATHVFLYRQDLGRNQAATEDAWPKAMAFFKRHLMTAGATASR
jgi:carboxymethylenebutenolidase